MQNIRKVKLMEFGEELLKLYGLHTIKGRAFPNLVDGLKPVHRRILWAMYQKGLTPTAKALKAAVTIGECFAAGTRVSTPEGDQPIENLLIGDVVDTSQGPRTVTQIFANPPAEMAELTLADGKQVILTLDQEVKIKVGNQFFWKKASELTPEDQVVTIPDE